MTLAVTGLVWWDPIGNWASYCIYDPNLWHYPVDWPLVKLSPTVEPFFCICMALEWMLPYFPVSWTRRFIQRRSSAGSFAWRHPLVLTAILTVIFGSAIDACLEIYPQLAGIYSYAQIPKFGALFGGTPAQYSLIQAIVINCLFIPVNLLLYKDETGLTVAEKLSRRLKVLPHRPWLKTFLVMYAFGNLGFSGYVASFGAIRYFGLGTSLACLYPYPEAKIYDPNGSYERLGAAGPYSEGFWNTWASRQPQGRPTITGPIPPGPCGPGHS